MLGCSEDPRSYEDRPDYLSAIANSIEERGHGIIDKTYNVKYLTELPRELFDLTNLTLLDLHRLRLTQLPPEIGKLTNLTHLDLVYKQLHKLPSEISNLINLKHLDFEGNSIHNLPPRVSRLTNLKE